MTIGDSVLECMPTGSGFDHGWEYHWQKNRKLVLSSSYHYLNQNGYYDGWFDFKVTIDNLETMDFRLNFLNNKRSHISEPLLREYMEELIAFKLHFMS